MSELNDLLPLQRKKVGEYIYPYGAFPDDDFEQREGYETEYQTPGEDEPPRYRTEVLVSAEKLVPLFLELCSLLPERVYVSLERASADVYTRWDEFMSDEVRLEDFLQVFRAYQFAFAEDGNLGIGAFSNEPSIEIFLGSHKEIVVFSPVRKPVKEILQRHGVAPRQLDLYYRREHTHVALTEYRGLRGPQFDFMHVAEVVRHTFGMELQQSEEENVDEEGNPLGLVPWHAVVVAVPVRRARAYRRSNRIFVQEFRLTAASRREARELLDKRLERDECRLTSLEELFRIDIEDLSPDERPDPDTLARAGIWFVGEKGDTHHHHDGPL